MNGLTRRCLQPTDGSPSGSGVGPTVFGVPGTTDILVRRHPVHSLCVVRRTNLTQVQQISARKVTRTTDILVRQHPVHSLCVVRRKNLTQVQQASARKVTNAKKQNAEYAEAGAAYAENTSEREKQATVFVGPPPM